MKHHYLTAIFDELLGDKLTLCQPLVEKLLDDDYWEAVFRRLLRRDDGRTIELKLNYMQWLHNQGMRYSQFVVNVNKMSESELAKMLSSDKHRYFLKKYDLDPVDPVASLSAKEQQQTLNCQQCIEEEVVEEEEEQEEVEEEQEEEEDVEDAPLAADEQPTIGIVSLGELRTLAEDNNYVVIGHNIFHQKPLFTKIMVLQILIENYGTYERDVKSTRGVGRRPKYDHATNVNTAFFRQMYKLCSEAGLTFWTAERVQTGNERIRVTPKRFEIDITKSCQLDKNTVRQYLMNLMFEVEEQAGTQRRKRDYLLARQGIVSANSPKQELMDYFLKNVVIAGSTHLSEGGATMNDSVLQQDKSTVTTKVDTTKANNGAPVKIKGEVIDLGSSDDDSGETSKCTKHQYDQTDVNEEEETKPAHIVTKRGSAGSAVIDIESATPRKCPKEVKREPPAAPRGRGSCVLEVETAAPIIISKKREGSETSKCTKKKPTKPKKNKTKPPTKKKEGTKKDTTKATKKRVKSSKKRHVRVNWNLKPLPVPRNGEAAVRFRATVPKWGKSGKWLAMNVRGKLYAVMCPEGISVGDDFKFEVPVRCLPKKKSTSEKGKKKQKRAILLSNNSGGISFNGQVHNVTIIYNRVVNN